MTCFLKRCSSGVERGGFPFDSEWSDVVVLLSVDVGSRELPTAMNLVPFGAVAISVIRIGTFSHASRCLPWLSYEPWLQWILEAVMSNDIPKIWSSNPSQRRWNLIHRAAIPQPWLSQYARVALWYRPLSERQTMSACRRVNVRVTGFTFTLHILITWSEHVRSVSSSGDHARLLTASVSPAINTCSGRHSRPVDWLCGYKQNQWWYI